MLTTHGQTQSVTPRRVLPAAKRRWHIVRLTILVVAGLIGLALNLNGYHPAPTTQPAQPSQRMIFHGHG